MNLKVGQVINDGFNDLIICAVKEHENSWYIYTLNEESDQLGFYKVNDLGEEYSFELVEDESDADAIIVNTCAFIDDAKKESIDCILEMPATISLGVSPIL